MPFLGGFLAIAFLLSNPVQTFASEPSAPSDIPAPQVPVKGTVVDINGEPLIGVGVLVKGTNTGAVTGLDGSFTVNASPDDILVFSSVGFVELELPASADLSRVVLEEDSELLDEVIVIGYGTTTRKSATGSVEAVRTELLENRPVANVTQALQGAAANVVIQRKSFNPNGESTNFNIRGISTTTDNTPLFVIDGLIADQSAFNNLNPNDIENLSVLKDAGTAAIYGSRSANGVILVTTKKGHKGDRSKVRFNALAGYNVPQFLFHATHGYENAVLTNLALTNSGNAPKFSQDQIRDLAANIDKENWLYYQLYEPALQQDYSASITGGSEKTSYMLSLGYHDQDSNYKSNPKFGAQRYNMRANITTEIGRLTITGIMAYTRNNQTQTTGSSIEINASRTPNYYYYKFKSDDGRYLVNDVVNDFSSLGQLESGSFNKYANNFLTASVNAEFKIIDGLKLRGLVGTDIIGNTRFTRNMPQVYWSSEEATVPRTVDDADYRTGNWNEDILRSNLQLLLDYNKTFGRHTVTGLVGATNESYTRTANEITKNYVDHELGIGTSKTTEANNTTGSTSMDTMSKTSITSILGRLGYNFDDRYYGEFSFRYDGSSKFAPEKRWGFFPSFAAGWRISQENFMENYRVNVGDLKLRGSWGILGNQSVGNYDRFTTYSVSGTSYGFDNTAVTTAGFKYGNEELTWEKTSTANVGIDAGFFKNSLKVTFDYFYKYTWDILMQPKTPGVLGTSMPRSNYGAMENRGWEITLNYNFKAGSTNHLINFNLADSKNRLVKFPGKEEILHGEELWVIRKEGLQWNAFYGYKYDGLFQSYEEIENSALPTGLTVHPGDVKRKDMNNDGVIDEQDRTVLGHAFPRFTFGLNYSFMWKGFDLSVFFQGVGKREQMIRGELVEPFHENYSYVIYKHQLNYWSPVNTGAYYPRLAAQGSDSDVNNWSKDWGTDLFIFDMKYIRLKNLAVGYTLPQKATRKIGMEKCRIYVNGQDLFTLCPTSFVDPETTEMGHNMNNNSGNSARNYPNIRYFGLGLDIEF